MSKRSKYTGEQKLQILQEVENEDLSLSSASRKYDINLSTIKDWILKYESLGIDSLEESRTWSHYTSEFKEMAVKSYLNQEGSYRNICVKYGIRDTKTLRSWVTRYNTGNSLNNTPGGTLTVDKGRKTSYEERIEITNHCLNINRNYRETAEIYEVSYQQVYSWVKKLEKSGEKALIDLRGKEKEANKMTEFDKLKIENRKLKKVNEELETENQLLKKLEELEKTISLGLVPSFILHTAIEELHKEGHSISSLCRKAGISRQAHYQYLKVDHMANEQTDEEICKQIAKIYDEVEGIYGYRQITFVMNREHGTRYNHKRIYRWMRIMGLKSVTRIKKNTYKKIPADHVAENILNREFIANRPNQKWLTDVTEFKTDEGKVYLSAFFDLHSNRVVSWKFGASNNNQLVFNNFKEALEMNPQVTPLIHSDRGYQYTSYGFQKILESRGLTQSMSRVGKCIDNGPMEGFWGKIKSECYHLHRKKSVYKTRQELIDDIDRYIRFYNNERPQKVLNGLTPREYYLLAS